MGPVGVTTVSAAQVAQRPLGKTGASVSLIGVGGFHIGQVDEAEGVRILRSALDRGVNFLDNCWDYHGGKSEMVTGKALLDGYRRRAFLMTKLDGRTRKAATAQLEQSLRRLRTDYIDLVQIHEVIRADDPIRCFRDGGSIETLLAARQAGKLRFIGFTGHKDPAIHLAMLAEAEKHGFRFDTVQMPLNVLDAHFRSFEKRVLPVAVEKGMGILGMKSMGAGDILASGVVSPVECLHYAMNLPTSVVITGCDSMAILDQAIDAAHAFQTMPPEDVARLLARTEAAAREGAYERFKTSDKYDGTARNPKWLTSAEL
jgi:aryl-alcohol dehydrogenase-like predicted oxidoreductase